MNVHQFQHPDFDIQGPYLYEDTAYRARAHGSHILDTATTLTPRRAYASTAVQRGVVSTQ